MIYLFVPFYSRINLYTAYEYLEQRFHLSVRLLCSALFQFLRCVHVAIAIYAPSIALSLVTGLPIEQCVLLMGVFTTLYTSFGGIRAVIWTDVLQFAIISLGIGLVFVIALGRIPGGWAECWKLASEAGRLRIWNATLDPTSTTSVWACVIGGTTLTLASLATDQALIQRLFTTRSERDSAQSIWTNAILGTPMLVVLSLIGTVLFAFYRLHPERTQGLPSSDAILPLFAVRELPSLASGLVIAAIFAASMAVMSAGINSLATATTIDFYRRLWRPGISAEQQAQFGRWLTLIWGITATLLGLFMGRLGDLAVAYSRVNSFVGGPMLGIFLLGILSVRATTTGAIAGAAAGIIAVAALAALTRVSFFFQAPVGVLVTCFVGEIVSRAGARPEQRQIDGLVFGRKARAGSAQPVAAK